MNSIEPVPFIVIGENIHATRTVSRLGRHIVRDGDLERVAFTDAAGCPRMLPIAGPVADSADFAKGRVKHIRNAILLGLAGDCAVPAELTGAVDPEAALAGRDYLIAAAQHQVAAGAHYIDINIDEISTNEAVRVVAIAWIVRLLEPALAVPLSLDSSSIAVLEAGHAASQRTTGGILLNSASAERPDVLDLAVRARAAVVTSAAGRGQLPADVDSKLANAEAIVGDALSRGLSTRDLHVDLLVLPVGVDPTAGARYLDAARRFRDRHGPEIRITGGLSNVSFGLPNRRLLNDVYTALAIDAGVDSGIVDPLGINVARIRTLDREARSFKLAADALLGRDAYAADYLLAFRSGALDDSEPGTKASPPL